MFDIYQAVTDRIIQAIEGGNIPWVKPWTGAGADLSIKYRDGKPYSLLNQLLLGEPGEYLSYKECEAAGGHVKKGEKGHMVVFWMMHQYEETDSDGNVIYKDGKAVMKTVPILRYYTVFHINQCECIKSKVETAETHQNDPIEEAEKVSADYISRSGVKLIVTKSDRAFYRPSTDTIHVPALEQYADVSEYYSTLFHEETHSTGHKNRLGRLDEKIAAFGDEDYSKEELVAELGACMILNRIGIESANSFRNSAGYLQGWLSALKNDKRLIVSAASKAEKAVKLIMGEE